MSKLTCPECGDHIDQTEQGEVEANFCVCGNCFTIIYRKARTTGDA